MDANELLDQLLTRPPDAVEAWAREAAAPADFNWLGLAEATGSDAVRAARESRDTALAWARVSVVARQRVADPGDPRERDRQTLAVMRLRAALIDRLGTVPGHPLLDCDEIVRWFLDRHGDADYDAALADAGRWQSLPTERIRDLRDIKNELAVVGGLAECPSVGAPEVQRWLALRDRLP